MLDAFHSDRRFAPLVQRIGVYRVEVQPHLLP